MPSVIKMRNVIAALVAVLAVASAALPTPDQYKVKGLEKYGAAGDLNFFAFVSQVSVLHDDQC